MTTTVFCLSVLLTHGSLIFIGVLRIYNVLYFLLLEDLSIFLVVFSGLLSAKWAVVHNTIEPALEVLCSSKLNFQFLEVTFQNERTVSSGGLPPWFFEESLPHLLFRNNSSNSNSMANT